MLEYLTNRWFKERPRKAKPDVVCEGLSRGGSIAVGKVEDPLKKNLRTSKGKIQD